MSDNKPEEPKKVPGSALIRGALNSFGGALPLLGGVLSAAASAWSEQEQEAINKFFKQWLDMLEDELREKAQTILEIAQRVDLHDEEIAKRVSSSEYQALLRKAFREWAAAESEAKRMLVRNILASAAASRVVSDDVVRMFLDWLRTFSELHFEVIGKVYNNAGITRGGIWRAIGRQRTREDAAEADLFKLLIRDLSMGSIIRQHRETDYHGNFIPARRGPARPRGSGPPPPTSAFDDEDPYELTQLGQQFVHYAMTDIPPKITFAPDAFDVESAAERAVAAE